MGLQGGVSGSKGLENGGRRERDQIRVCLFQTSVGRRPRANYGTAPACASGLA